MQSSIGSPLVVGDSLYFYFSGRTKASAGMYNRDGKNSNFWAADVATGLAMIRRDGFASMDVEVGGGTLTTHPVTFTGRYLFVNVNCPAGELKAEVLDSNNNLIAPYTLVNSIPVSRNATLAGRESSGLRIQLIKDSFDASTIIHDPGSTRTGRF